MTIFFFFMSQNHQEINKCTLNVQKTTIQTYNIQNHERQVKKSEIGDKSIGAIGTAAKGRPRRYQKLSMSLLSTLIDRRAPDSLRR